MCTLSCRREAIRALAHEREQEPGLRQVVGDDDRHGSPPALLDEAVPGDEGVRAVEEQRAGHGQATPVPMADATIAEITTM